MLKTLNMFSEAEIGYIRHSCPLKQINILWVAQVHDEPTKTEFVYALTKMLKLM